MEIGKAVETIGWLEVTKVNDEILRINYESNVEHRPRSGIIYLSIGEVSAQIKILQASAPHINISSSPTIHVSHLASDTTLSVSVEQGTWQADAGFDWIQLEPHLDEDYLRVAYQENASSASRQATITISIAYIDIAQEIILIQSSAPRLSISPSSLISLDYLSGDTTLSVSLSSGAWQATETPAVDWLDIVPQQSSDALTIAYQSNINAERSATVRLSVVDLPIYKEITFTQNGSPTLTIRPSQSISLSYLASDTTLSVSLSSGTWRASVPLSVDWLSVNKPSSSTLKATYKRHTGSSPRSVRATVSVTGLSLSEEIVFTQGVASALSVTPTEFSAHAGSGSQAFNVSSAHLFQVSQSPVSVDWITSIVSSEEGFTVHYKENTRSDARSVTLVAGLLSDPLIRQSLTFTQNASPTLLIRPSQSISLSYLASDTTLSVSLSSGTWRASVPLSVDWLSVNKPSSSTLKATYKRHTGSSPRSVRATVSVAGLSLSEEIVFTQGVASALSVTPTEFSAHASAGSQAFNVSSAHLFQVSQSPVSVDWITSIVSSEEGFTVHYKENTRSDARSVTLVAGLLSDPLIRQSLTFTQNASPTLMIRPSQSISLSYLASDTTLSVSLSSGTWRASVPLSVDWLSVNKPSSSTLKATYKRHTGSSPRSVRATVSVAGLSLSEEIVFTQGVASALSVTPTEFSAHASAGSQSFNVSSDHLFQVSQSPVSVDWITSIVSSEDGFIVHYKENTRSDARSVTLVAGLISDPLIRQSLTFTQNGSPTLTIRPSQSISLSYLASDTTLSVSLSSGTWRASVPLSVDWLSVNKPSSSTLKATYKRHTGSSPRSVRATVSVTGLSLSEEIVFTQGVASALSVTPTEFSAHAGSGSQAFNVSSAHLFQVSQSPVSVDWITSIVSSEEGFTVHYKENTRSDARSVTLVAGLLSDPLIRQSLTFTQNGSPTLTDSSFSVHFFKLFSF